MSTLQYYINKVLPKSLGRIVYDYARTWKDEIREHIYPKLDENTRDFIESYKIKDIPSIHEKIYWYYHRGDINNNDDGNYSRSSIKLTSACTFILEKVENRFDAPTVYYIHYGEFYCDGYYSHKNIDPNLVCNMYLCKNEELIQLISRDYLFLIGMHDDLIKLFSKKKHNNWIKYKNNFFDNEDHNSSFEWEDCDRILFSCLVLLMYRNKISPILN